MEQNQRSSKSRSHAAQKAHKKVENTHQGLKTSSAGSDPSGRGAEEQFISVDLIRQQFAAQKGGVVVGVSSHTLPTPHVKVRPGVSFVQGAVPSQVLVLKADKEGRGSPRADPAQLLVSSATPASKSSSLSREISPSRITAQVVSAMSESTSQPLLLSALTGKLSAPMLIPVSSSSSPRPEAHMPPSSARRSPYQVQEHRRSPANPDVTSQGRIVHGTWDQLTQAAALLCAQESVSAKKRPQAELQPGNHKVSRERKTPSPKPQTPSPKPPTTAQTHSPKPQTTSQTHSPKPPTTAPQRLVQQRSPVGLRLSPAPSQGHDVFNTFDGGMMVYNSSLGLVQQHLLSAPLASTCVPSATALQSFANQPVPSVPSTSGLQLSSLPADISPVPVKSKAPRSSHVTSVGIGTESKECGSHGEQTRKVLEPSKLPPDIKVTVSGHVYQPHAKGAVAEHGFPVTTSGMSVEMIKGHDVNVQMMGGHGNHVGLAGVKVQSALLRSKLSTTASAPSSQCVTAAVSSTATTLSPSSSSSSAASVSSLSSNSFFEHRRHSPSPITSQKSKPLNIPSTQCHSPSSTVSHQPSPSHHLPISSTSGSTFATVVNHIAPTPAIVRLPTTWTVGGPATSIREKPLCLAEAAAPVKVEVERREVTFSTSYQPHHHRPGGATQPAQTITSEVGVGLGGPVVKAFVPVMASVSPPPAYNPLKPLPPHINPFTFPTTGVKIHPPSGEGPTYSLASRPTAIDRNLADTIGLLPDSKGMSSVGRKSVADLVDQRNIKESSVSDTDLMPRLSPEAPKTIKTKINFKQASLRNHVSGSDTRKESLMQPFNMRLQNLGNFPSMATAYRSAYRSHSVAVQRAKAGLTTSAAKSLDLLRQNIQKNINQELNHVLKKYIEKFFQPAAENIRLNNGSNAVSEEHINAVCRQIFDEAKRMYTNEARRSVTPVESFQDNISECGSTNGVRKISPNPFVRRLKASDSDSEKGSDSGISRKIPRRKGRPPLNNSGRITPLKPIKLDSVKREGPKWDPERITETTQFVMGARANKALGLGNTRGRLYIRHPDVFKYSGDQEDKIWLYEQKLMPATGGKAYMLLVEDIFELSKTDEYKDSPTLLMHECRGFTVPDWMQAKAKAQMQALRSDSSKHRSRSRSPLSDRPDPPKTLPFSNLSDTASNNDMDSVGNKNSLQPSPADTEEMDFLSGMDNEDTQPSDISSFNVTGGFDDTPSRSPCPLDHDQEDDNASCAPYS